VATISLDTQSPRLCYPSVGGRALLKDIADHLGLGHRVLNSTALYAPANLTGLLEVANLSLGGLL
jgi:hypothetical protein